MTLFYIDPGTGSMLFSIVIGAAATLFFLAKAAWLKFKLFFSGQRGKEGAVKDASYTPYVIIRKEKTIGTHSSPFATNLRREKFPWPF